MRNSVDLNANILEITSNVNDIKAAVKRQNLLEKMKKI